MSVGTGKTSVFPCILLQFTSRQRQRKSFRGAYSMARRSSRRSRSMMRFSSLDM